jgi:hypothetical protein
MQLTLRHGTNAQQFPRPHPLPCPETGNVLVGTAGTNCIPPIQKTFQHSRKPLYETVDTEEDCSFKHLVAKRNRRHAPSTTTAVAQGATPTARSHVPLAR